MHLSGCAGNAHLEDSLNDYRNDTNIVILETVVVSQPDRRANELGIGRLDSTVRHTLVRAKTRTRSPVAFKVGNHFITIDRAKVPHRLVNYTKMAELQESINGLFAPSSALSPDIMGELESILQLYSISPQELFYKWESYSLKMGSEDTKLDLNTVRMFKKDVQDSLERNVHDRQAGRGSDRKSNVGATPRAAAGGDVFGMQVCAMYLSDFDVNHSLQA
jgi:DNA polymerase alpha subunit B N-terminal